MNSHFKDSEIACVPSCGIESIAMTKNVPIPAITQYTKITKQIIIQQS